MAEVNAPAPPPHQQCVSPPVAPAASVGTAATSDGEQEDEGELVSIANGEVPTLAFMAEITKTDKGLGIYFARRAVADGSDMLTVDGFVEDAQVSASAEADPTKSAADGLARLVIGDVLTQINGVDCSQMDVADTVALLRAAPQGPNTLSFSRTVADADPSTATGLEDEETDKARESGGSLAGSFIGALRKVKSRMRTEMDEGARREQEEHARFEQQWLAEFSRFKAANERKWETCTYSADEFCGHVYLSSDAQQRARLEDEFPTLMEAWKECQDMPSALPQWPPPKASVDAPVEIATVSCEDSAEAPRLVRDVECAPALLNALEFLRREFMWRHCHVDALGRRLEALGLRSCAQLLDAMDDGARSGLFERRLQSPEFPRLTKAVCQALRSGMEQAVVARGEVAGAEQWAAAAS